MQKVTLVYPDEVEIDYSIFNKATSFSVEKVVDKSKKTKLPITRNRVPGTTSSIALMEHFIPQGKFSLGVAQDWLRPKGYANNTAYTTLSKLILHGYIQSIGNQEYRFLKPYVNGAL